MNRRSSQFVEHAADGQCTWVSRAEAGFGDIVSPKELSSSASQVAESAQHNTKAGAGGGEVGVVGA